MVGHRLDRIITVNRDAGDGVTLLGLELYDDGLILRWSRAGDDWLAETVDPEIVAHLEPRGVAEQVVEQHGDPPEARWVRVGEPIERFGPPADWKDPFSGPLSEDESGLVITDDAQTGYRQQGGNADFYREDERDEHTAFVCHGIVRFDPAVPAHATRLGVRYGDHAPIDIAL